MKVLTNAGKWGVLGAALLATGVFAQQAKITATTGTGQAVVLDLGGWQVTDASNQKVGKVEHMVVSPSGCIDAVVLNMEGNRLVPVPWQVVTVEKSTRLIGGAQPVLHVSVDRAKLQSAPTVTKEQMITISQNTQIYQHFGVQPQSSGVGASGSPTGSAQGSATTPGTTAPDSSKSTTPQGSTGSGSTNIQGSATSPGTTPGSSTTPDSQTSTNKTSGSDFQQPSQPSDTRPPANRPPSNTPSAPQ